MKFRHEPGLSNEDNIRKIRLLTLASISSGHIGAEISYNDIANALEIDESEVEMWTIDGKLGIGSLYYQLSRQIDISMNHLNSY